LDVGLWTLDFLRDIGLWTLDFGLAKMCGRFQPQNLRERFQ
jgi:hypothetical protein